MKNAYIWILWLANTILFLLSTRNPTYLLFVLVNLFLLGNKIARGQHHNAWTTLNLRFLISMILISSVVNGLFTHIGQTTLLQFPQKLPLIGGNITLESIIYGAINGLMIGALYLAFNILNLALNVKQLSRLIPRAFHPIAMTTTIALTFFPSIQQRAHEIKEAQMIRGNPMKKISDWLPILLPLLVTSLEDAITLSESMTSRGFLAVPKSDQTHLVVINLMLATFSIFSGWILNLYNYPRLISFLLYAIGGSVFGLTLILKGREFRVTHYRQITWHTNDVILGIIFLISIILQITFSMIFEFDLAYSPYPQLSLPKIEVMGILFCTLPILPIAVSNND